ncbi:DUF1365 domain-containing protein [Streptomyces sp. NPDC006274]|uniref:DUF1365 domain-containing protein n=1 Tax=unclassified Streptomyces TaxID=2593676 RepID=UPI0033AC11E0
MTPPTHAPTKAGTPALYDCVVRHARSIPLRHRFRHRTYLWLVDVDHIPVLPRLLRPLARFDPRDHFGGTAPSLRAGIDACLRAHGVDLNGGRVLMLAHARVLGYVFNPITVYWCHDRAGALECVVAEVHNTYGQRHCYLLRTDESGTAQAEKDFYVSPFFPVDGTYRMRLPLPGEQLDLTVRLRRGDAIPFTATVHGTRRPATAGQLLRAALRRPWSTAVASAAIRHHGIRLLLRGLPVQPRPPHRPRKGMK